VDISQSHLQCQNTNVQSLDIVRNRILDLHTGSDGKRPKMAFRRIAQLPDYLGVPPGTLCSIAKGRDPKSPRIRTILGLPALALAPVCVKCGEVHPSKRCTKGSVPKPRIKHICENCRFWISENIPHVDLGDCDNGKVYETIVDQSAKLATMSDFGCIFWKRKEENHDTPDHP
jgi:hypothetical protein